MPDTASLSDKVDPRHTALIIIDVQNDFCSPEGVFGRAGIPIDFAIVDRAVDRMEALLAAARRAGVAVLFVRSEHDSWTESAARAELRARWGTEPSCIQGTWGAESYRLRPRPEDHIVPKRRYSAFFGTDLDIVLRVRGISTVVLAGIQTNVCVETTARDAYMRDYRVVFVDDCCATNDQAAHKATLANVATYFGTVVRSEQVIRAWERS